MAYTKKQRRVYNAAYRLTPTGRAARAHAATRAAVRQRLLYPDQVAAHHAVNNAIRGGYLIRLPCEVCGEPKSEGHHFLGHVKEHWFDIQWLCKKHHSELHKGENKCDLANATTGMGM